MNQTIAQRKAVAAQRSIERAAKAARPQVRVIEAIKVGQAIRQGDIYVTRIAVLPAEAHARTNDRQLAPGTTRGSRHVVAGDVEVYTHDAGSWSRLIGPVIVASKRFRIDHPEHAAFDLPPGVYQVTFQRDFNRGGTDRVSD